MLVRTFPATRAECNWIHIISPSYHHGATVRANVTAVCHKVQLIERSSWRRSEDKLNNPPSHIHTHTHTGRKLHQPPLHQDVTSVIISTQYNTV